MRVIDRDVFFVSSNNRVAVYAPLRGVLFEVSPEALDRINQEEPSHSYATALLDKAGLIVDEDSLTELPDAKIETDFKPTGVIYMVTNACNFRCRYCYAEAGKYSVKKFNRKMGFTAAKMVIDNAAERGLDKAYLNFHGGGEPTCDFPFIREMVESSRAYASERYHDSIEVVASLVTNGSVSKENLEWIARNVDSVQVSYDGYDEIQNLQRPTANGNSTEKMVRDAILYLQDKIPDLLIKSTISAYSVSFMPEIAEHLCRIFSIKRFHMGPVLGAGRGLDKEFGEPEAQKFIDGAIKAQQIAKSYGKSIVVSGTDDTYPNIRVRYCGATDPNFVLTADGCISSCYEVMHEDDPRGVYFWYGKYNANNDTFVIDMGRLQAIRKRVKEMRPLCDTCFARWQCAGDCQARWWDSITGEENKKYDIRCLINRELIRRHIFQTLDDACEQKQNNKG